MTVASTKRRKVASEQDITSGIIDALKRYPSRCRPMRRNAGSKSVRMRGNEAGTPDIEVMCSGGRTVWLETKTPIGKLSAAQIGWHMMASMLGHRVVVVRSVQEAIDAVLPRQAT